MRRCGQPCADPKTHVGDERSGHREPAQQIVQAVPEQNQIRQRPWGPCAFVVGVVPVEELLQGEKNAG